MSTREQEVCQLCWSWEVQVPELETSVFIVPKAFVKNDEDRLMHTVVAIKVKDKITDINDMADVVDSQPKSLADVDKFHGTREQVGCTMPS